MPELRRDPVVGRWVVFSPERQIRPERYVCEELPPTKPEDNPFLEGHEAYTPPEPISRHEVDPSTATVQL